MYSIQLLERYKSSHDVFTYLISLLCVGFLFFSNYFLFEIEVCWSKYVFFPFALFSSPFCWLGAHCNYIECKSMQRDIAHHQFELGITEKERSDERLHVNPNYIQGVFNSLLIVRQLALDCWKLIEYKKQLSVQQ